MMGKFFFLYGMHYVATYQLMIQAVSLRVSHRVWLPGVAAQWAESRKNGKEVTFPSHKTVCWAAASFGKGSSVYHDCVD